MKTIFTVAAATFVPGLVLTLAPAADRASPARHRGHRDARRRPASRPSPPKDRSTSVVRQCPEREAVQVQAEDSLLLLVGPRSRRATAAARWSLAKRGESIGAPQSLSS